MSVELSRDAVPAVLPAVDTRTPGQKRATRIWAAAALLALAGGFVLIGGGNLDLGPIESRLGLAAGEGFGPFGQVFGGWEPKVWPAQLAPSVLWAWGEGGTPSSASVRWPSAIAGVLLGLILARRVQNTLGTRAALLAAVCIFGSAALIDRSAGAGLDLIAGLATVAAIDRILGNGTDVVAGGWAAAAFLAAGWPPVVLVLLLTVVLGRRGATLSPGLLIPPLLAAAAWSAWALKLAPPEAWAAALALPLTEKSAWGMAGGVVALGLPWSPFAVLAAFRSVRDRWTPPARALIVGWLQVAGASFVVGTVVPGMATAARLPALAGLALAAAASCERVWSGTVSAAARRGFLTLAATVVTLWTLIAIGGGIGLASAVSYYRTLAIVLIVLALPVAALAVVAVEKADPRRALLALTLVACCLKIAHVGYYVPEWNYRRSQGPWGRAIGQWVPPRWPIYTTHTWGTDLAFATGRTVRQLVHPKVLDFQPGSGPKFVLLLDSEFAHWPSDAPRLVKVAGFQDEHGDGRILARTPGDFSWRLARRTHED